MSSQAALMLAALAAGLFAARWAGKADWPAVRTVLVRALAIGLVIARFAYVMRWRAAYAEHPWQLLDLLDGGFDVEFGTGVAALVAITSMRQHPQARRGVVAAFAAAALIWLPGSIALMARSAPGPSLPTVALADLEGARLSLDSFKGKPVVVNLWATWCPPCRRELPLLMQAQRERPDLHVVFVDQGEPGAEVAAYLASQQLAPRNLLLDEAKQTGAAFDQRGYPTTLFFDPQGRLVARHLGELTEAALAERLSRLKAAGPSNP
jgi:thiol-disulfide isomerase/thioredoxin